MKNTYRNIPAMPVANDADVEALRRQLEGGNLEAHKDGTLGPKNSGSQCNAAPQNNAYANKKKMGDVPGGVLGAESLRDILARAENSEAAPEPPVQPAQPGKGADKGADKGDKKSMGSVPSGVLGADTEEKTVSPEVAAMINEFRSDERMSAPDKADMNAKKIGDVPGGVLGTQQWYSQPEKQQQLQFEIAGMKPFVGEVRWGVNAGTLPDGRMYWKVRQPIKAERRNGGILYNNVYDILLVYQPNHPHGEWGTSVHAYLMAPHDITWLQERVNRSPRTPKNIPHLLIDDEKIKYLCTAGYDDFGTSYTDSKGVATAKTALLCAIKWLHNWECGLLSQEHWELFQEHGRL